MSSSLSLPEQLVLLVKQLNADGQDILLVTKRAWDILQLGDKDRESVAGLLTRLRIAETILSPTKVGYLIEQEMFRSEAFGEFAYVLKGFANRSFDLDLDVEQRILKILLAYMSDPVCCPCYKHIIGSRVTFLLTRIQQALFTFMQKGGVVDAFIQSFVLLNCYLSREDAIRISNGDFVSSLQEKNFLSNRAIVFLGQQESGGPVTTLEPTLGEHLGEDEPNDDRMFGDEDSDGASLASTVPDEDR